MRLAGLLLAICFTCVLLLQAAAVTHADEPTPAPGPFPSPSPTAALAGGNGYAALTFNAASTSGGTVLPSPASTSTPASFKNANAGGFSLDILGRISPTYLASLRFDDYSIRGNDNPFVSYWQGMVLYNPHSAHLALGAGYAAAQRSSSAISLTGAGLGVMYVPDFRPGASPYGSLFIYPRLRSSAGSSSLTCLDAGIIFSPPRRGGLFYRLGGFSKSGGGGSSFSPTQVSGFAAGVGAAF